MSDEKLLVVPAATEKLLIVAVLVVVEVFVAFEGN